MPGFVNTVANYAKGVREGRGQGRFSSYSPWLKVQDVKSSAQRTRIYSRRFGRHYHFFSNGELLAFYQLEFRDDVIEIREQFPLAPEVTNQIAKELGVLPAGYTFGGTVMTTDFLVTYKTDDSDTYQKAFQIKATLKDARKPRTNTKLLIEQLYWKRKGVPCVVVVSEDFNITYCDNLRLIFPFRDYPYTNRDLIYLFRNLKPFLDREILIGDFRLDIPLLPDAQQLVTAQEALKILTGHKWLSFPIRKRAFLDCRLSDFAICHVLR